MDCNMDRVNKADSIMMPIKKKDLKVTDKCALTLFFIAFSVWILSCGYVIYDGYFTTTKRNVWVYFKDKSWLAVLLTSNFSSENYDYFRDDYKKPGICTAYSICLVNLWFANLGFHNFYTRKSLYLMLMSNAAVGIGFIIVSMIYRKGLLVVERSLPDRNVYRSFALYITPELKWLLLYSIATMLMFFKDIQQMKYACKTVFRCCYDLFCATLFGIVFIIIMLFVQVITTWLINELDWTNFFLYVIFSGSCFTAYFIYNFGNAVIALAIWRSHGRKITFGSVLFSIYTVTRYHIGSVAFHSTVLLPLIIIKRSKSKLFFDNKKRDDQDYFYTGCLPIDYPLKLLMNQKYFFDVFRRNLIFIVVYGLSYQESTEMIVSRYFTKGQFPRSWVWFPSWLSIFLDINVTNYLFLGNIVEQHFHKHTYFYKLESFSIITTIAYIKIASVIFVLNMMVINNYILITNLHHIETKNTCQKKNNEKFDKIAKII